MASFRMQKTYDSKSDQEVYEAALKAFPIAGFEVWKKRELARLVLGKGEEDGKEFRSNIIVNMVDASATITAESDDLPESVLQSIVEKIGTELDHLLV